MLGCCPHLPGHWPPRGWERLPGLAFPSLQSLCLLGVFLVDPFFPLQWLGHGQSGGPGSPVVSPVEVATRVGRGAVWTPHPRMVVPPALGLPMRGHPATCSSAQVTQVTGSWLEGCPAVEPWGLSPGLLAPFLLVLFLPETVGRAVYT